MSTDESRDREREGDREADVAGIEHRRMDDQARVLQQRVQIRTVGERRDVA